VASGAPGAAASPHRYESGDVYGAEAVTYKDRSAGLLGKELASGVFLMLTKIHKFYEG
jgi:carbamate kinase